MLSKTNPSRNAERLYEILAFLLIVVIWAFNEEKYLSYPIKILFIIGMIFYGIWYKKSFNLYHLWCLMIIPFSVIGIAVGGASSVTIYNFVNFIQVILIGFAAMLYIDSEDKISKVMNFIMLGGVILSLRLLLLTPLSTWTSFERLGEVIGYNSNDVGNKAALSAVFALSLFRTAPSKHKKFYLIAFALLSVIVLFSGSRKSLLIIALFVALVYSIGLKNKKNLIFSILGVCILFIAAYHVIMANDSLYATIGRRVESMINTLFNNGSEAGSIDLRKLYIDKAWELVKESPVVGIGIGNFAVKSGYGVYCHCDYLEVMCSFGLFGAVMYYLPWIVTTLRVAFLCKKNTADYNMLSLMLSIIILLFTTMVMYLTAYVQIILVLVIAYLKLRSQKPKKETDLCLSYQE